MVLRLTRRVQFHHRRQAAGLTVGDGPVRPPLRLQQLEHAGPAGSPRGGDRRPAVRDGAAVVRPGRRAADRRGHGSHPGRGAHVPLQQPRRAARPVARRRRLRADPGPGEGGHALAAACRGARRVRLPDQDVAGVAGAARLRAGLPHRRADPAATASLADARGRGGDGRGRRLVGRHRGTVAGGESSLHRRVDQQQRSRPGVRLQRTEPPQRRRRAGRRCGRRPGWRRWLQWRHRTQPDVQRRDRQPDLLVAARGPDRLHRRIVVDAPCAPHQPRPSGDAAVGWMAAGHGRRVQLHERHLPRVLHRGAGSSDRRSRWDRGPGALAHQAGQAFARAARRDDGRHRGVGLRAAESNPGLDAVAALRRPDCDRDGCRGAADRPVARQTGMGP